MSENILRHSIDLETMGTCPRSAVLVVGIASYHPEIGVAGYERRADPRLSGQLGNVDVDTMVWWMGQNPNVQAFAFNGKMDPRLLAEDIVEHLRSLEKRAGTDNIEVWANAPTFDCAVIRHLFDQVGVECPWSFRQERCVRTARAFTGQRTAPRNAHRALDDAMAQLVDVLDFMGELGAADAAREAL